MNCSDIERYVYVYLDGEFEERELREFEVHTAQCDSCRRRVASEEQYLLGLQAQWELPRAPDALRQRIQASLAAEAEGESGGWFGRGVGGFEGSLWFSGAFAAALAMVVFWGEIPSGFLDDSSAGPSSSVSSALGAGLTSSMTEVSSAIVPNRALSLVSNELVDNALETHQIDLPLEVRREPASGVRFLSPEQLALKRPPLEESNDTRLLGSRVLRGGLAKSVLFAYDHCGVRVTAVQTMLPRGWERMGGFYSENRRGDHTVVTWRDGRVVTTIVSPDPRFDPMRMRATPASR